jgi:uncharacterized protein YjbI with pentapeptide repeats
LEEQSQKYIDSMQEMVGQSKEESLRKLKDAEGCPLEKLQAKALQKYATLYESYSEAKTNKEKCLQQARDMAESADTHGTQGREDSHKAAKLTQAVEEEKERQRSTEQLEKEMKRMWGPEYVLTPDKLPDALVNAVMRLDATVKTLEKRFEETLESQRTNYESRFELLKDGFEKRIDKLETFVEKQIERYEATNKSTSLSPRELYDYYARGTRNFAGVVLEGNFLFGMTFEKCDFRDANMKDCDLRNTRFVDCKFNRGNLSGCILDYAHFSECVLVNTNLKKCTFKNTTFHVCNFTNAELPDSGTKHLNWTATFCDHRNMTISDEWKRFILSNLPKCTKDWKAIVIDDAAKVYLLALGLIKLVTKKEGLGKTWINGFWDDSNKFHATMLASEFTSSHKYLDTSGNKQVRGNNDRLYLFI